MAQTTAARLHSLFLLASTLFKDTLTEQFVQNTLIRSRSFSSTNSVQSYKWVAAKCCRSVWSHLTACLTASNTLAFSRCASGSLSDCHHSHIISINLHILSGWNGLLCQSSRVKSTVHSCAWVCQPMPICAFLPLNVLDVLWSLRQLQISSLVPLHNMRLRGHEQRPAHRLWACHFLIARATCEPVHVPSRSGVCAFFFPPLLTHDWVTHRVSIPSVVSVSTCLSNLAQWHSQDASQSLGRHSTLNNTPGAYQVNQIPAGFAVRPKKFYFSTFCLSLSQNHSCKQINNISLINTNPGMNGCDSATCNHLYPTLRQPRWIGVIT